MADEVIHKLLVHILVHLSREPFQHQWHKHR